MSEFEPQTDEEREIFAAERFRVDLQHKLQTVMNLRNVNQKELARRMGVSEARISQVFSSKCNATARFIARMFHVLGDEVWIDSKALQAARRVKNGGAMQKILDCNTDAWRDLSSSANNNATAESA